ncbi:hypothetical protein [Actinomadura rupiterrae]|uniref:hypothetical protein n=1 Tax=Actinomadura rupiterrae TaxID=559627 RepID=UPI0020A3CDC1|nr:hypothetical protein [Actinomadura rupiterrae]MCP2339214.1 hypothetical protein [Actinomadura rupiterrae]
MSSDLRPCGTRAAYERHRRHGQPIDEACRKAKSAYVYAKRGGYQRARNRALTRLARTFPEMFARLEAEHFAADGVTSRSGGVYQRSRRRAMAELARTLPERYAPLLAAELAAEARRMNPPADQESR